MTRVFGVSLMLWGLYLLALVPPNAPPKLFMNIAILGLYILAILWWAFVFRSWWDAAYWASAAAITFVVTFGTLLR